MKPIDYAVALGAAVAILALNLAFAVLVVTVYAMLIEPGHPQEFYEEAAKKIAPWCSHTFGTALFLAAGYLFTRRKPERNRWLFASVMTLLYAVIDSAMIGFAGLFAVEFVLSMLAKYLAALAGAFLARPKGSADVGGS